MDYLDYLADHTYAELPPEVQATISAQDYSERRRISQTMNEDGNQALPPALAAAFLAFRPAQEGPRTQEAKQVVRGKVRYLPWLAAAGWLLFALMAGNWFFTAPQQQTVYRVLAAEIPPPEVIHTRDTLVLTKYRTRVRAQIVYDTIYQPAPPPQLVYLNDTIFVPMPLVVSARDSLSGSQSLAGRESFLQFLYAME